MSIRRMVFLRLTVLWAPTFFWTGFSLAQSPLSLEVRGGVAFATGDLSENQDHGYNLETLVRYDLGPRFALGFGLDTYQLRGKVGPDSIANPGVDAFFYHGSFMYRPYTSPRLHAEVSVAYGATRYRVKSFTLADGHTARVEQVGPGFQLDTGLVYKLTRRFSSSARVGYTRFNASRNETQWLNSGAFRGRAFDTGTLLRLSFGFSYEL